MEDSVTDGEVVQEEREGSPGMVEVGLAEAGPRAAVFPLYPQRWAVLITVLLLNISNASLWINIAPVAYKASEYFQVEVSAINWFSVVYLVVAFPFTFISTITVNSLGLAPVIHIGSALNCLGGVLRTVSTSGLISSLPAQFAVSITGQTFAGMAQCFVLFIPTKLSQLWFPEDGRALSTTILSLSNTVGILVAQVTSPLLVPDKTHLPMMNYVHGGVALLVQVVTLVCINRSKPPTPPSYSAECGERNRAPYLQQLREAFTTMPYLLLLISLGCGVAIFSSLVTLTQQLLCPLGYHDIFSGVANAVMILSGLAGSAVTGILADRTKAFAPITLLFYGFAAIFCIVMLEMFMVPGQPAIVAVSAGLFGFFGLGSYPIGLELAVEATYPVEESISTAFIFLSGQILGVAIISLVTLLAQDQRPEFADIQVCTKDPESEIVPKDYTVSLMVVMSLMSFVVCLVITFFKSPYKRLEAERISRSSNTSISSSFQSLSVTSGYASQHGTDTSSSTRLSDRSPDIEATVEDKEDDQEPDFEQCHL